MAYQPYNPVIGIVNNKIQYDTAKATGGNFNQYRDAAKPFYEDLRSNGYGDVAAQLQRMNASQALEYAKQFEPKATSNQFLLDLQKTASGEKAPKMSEQTQGLYNQLMGNDARLNGEIKYDENGNVVSGLNTDFYNKGTTHLDEINKFDVTAQPYYQKIMGDYKLKGEDAANGEYANGAADNGGNIDSYAAANANRQQLAFTNAGFESALKTAQQNEDNWQSLYKQIGGQLTEQGEINAENLKTAADMYGIDAATQQTAADIMAKYFENNENNETAIEQQRMKNDIEQMLAQYDVQTAQEKTAADRYAAELEADAKRYAADREYDAAVAKANGTSGTDEGDGADNDSEKDIQDLINWINNGYITSYQEAQSILAEKYGATDAKKMLDVIASGVGVKSISELSEYITGRNYERMSKIIPDLRTIAADKNAVASGNIGANIKGYTDEINSIYNNLVNSGYSDIVETIKGMSGNEILNFIQMQE